MKIFSWVHRRFHQKCNILNLVATPPASDFTPLNGRPQNTHMVVLERIGQNGCLANIQTVVLAMDDQTLKIFGQSDEVSQDVKKVELIANAKDNLSLLDNAAMDGVFEFDGWKEGILAIGTFGFDPALLKDFDDHEDDAYLSEYTRKELANDHDEDNGEEIIHQEEEVEFPLVFKACKHGFFHDQKDNHMTQCEETCKPNDHEDGHVDDIDQTKKAKKVGERITLADLFWADSDKNLLNKKLSDDQEQVKVSHIHESNIKHTSYDDKVALISKKKITKDNAARPIKKINRMVRKMLKKKIHPDVANQKDKCAFEVMREHGLVKNA